MQYEKDVEVILKESENEMIMYHHPYVGTEHLLLSLLKRNKIKDICNKYNLTYDRFKDELLKCINIKVDTKDILYTPLLKLVIDRAYENASKCNDDVNDIYLLSSLLDSEDGIALRILDNMNINYKDISKHINNKSIIYELGTKVKESSAYLRDKEIDMMIEVLLRCNKCNPLLIGKAGVGKTALVHELAKRINEGTVPDELKDKEIIEVSTANLLAGTKYRGEFESKVNTLINECIKCKNIILFIDEIHTIMKTGSSDGAIDAANILKPYLARGCVKVIGATTIEEYNEYIKKDSALNRRFTPIMINEPSNIETNYIINSIKDNYKVKISKKCVSYLIDVCDKYMPNMCNPDKSIELLDTLCSRCKLNNYYTNSKNICITKKDIDSIIRSKINICNIDSNKLNDIYNELSIKYNESIIRNIFNIIKDKSLNKYMYLNGINDNKKKILDYIAYKLNINKIVLDCKYLSDEYNINKYVYSDYLYNEILNNPYSFIIVDKYNYANKVVYNMIDDMINNGYITNKLNEKAYLGNSIIFILNDCNDNLGFKLLFSS